MRPSYGAERTGKVPRPAVARGASIPAPIGGWDAISPLANMPADRAVQLDNWFPQTGWVELRRGYIRHCNTATGEAVETLASYQGGSSNAMFAVSDNQLFDVTTSTAVLVEAGLTNSRFQHSNFVTTGGNFLYMVNGADEPRYYDGSAWATATITGEDSTRFVTVTPHKNRLWFAQTSSADAAYLDVDSIQGAATAFPVGGNWSLGGYLMQIASWSLDAGDGPDDYIAFISSRGQVSVFKGVDPDTDFVLVGTYTMGPPIGRRCITKVGADVAVICLDGVAPLSKALIYERAAVQQVTLTQNILRVMNQSARDYKDNFGWQLISYPKGTRAILNVPITENSLQHQYVMNTLSGAWCRFIGMNGSCWEVNAEDDLFFGGNDGQVYQADTAGNDYNQTLTADFMTAYNYYGLRGNQKRWMNCRPQITTDQQVTPGLAFNTDFQTNAAISTQATPAQQQALWDEALWDESVWAGVIVTQSQWTSVTGLGYCASIRMKVDIDPPGVPGVWGLGLWGEATWGVAAAGEIVLRVNAFDLTYEKGAQI